MTAQKSIEAIYPLSSLQQGILFHSVEAPNTGVYFQQAILTLRGQLDLPAMERAWQHAVDRHPALRTIFVWEHRQKPFQIVIEGMKLPWQTLDWREWPEEQQCVQRVEFLASDRKKGFDLFNGPLLRVALIRLKEDLYDLIWSFHHLLLDGWSLMLVLNEVLSCYAAFARGTSPVLPPVQPYRDYISWLQQQDLSAAQIFWQRFLNNISTSPLPGAAARTANRSDSNFATEERKIPEGLTAKLQSLARSHKLTLNSIAQGAWALLLNCYTGSLEPVYGVVVSGRPPALPGVESMVGLLINTLLMRVHLAPADTLLSVLGQIQSTQAEMSQFEYSPIVEVQGWANVPRTQPLFDSIFVYENTSSLDWPDHSGDDLTIEAFQAIEQTNYPLTLVVGPGRELLLRATYDCGCFNQPLIHRLLLHLETLLQKICKNPHAAIGATDPLTEEERSQVLFQWNDTHTPSKADFVHQWIEEQTARAPDAVAVVCGKERITYRELSLRSSMLACRLRERGIGPEERVAVLMERSPSLIVALLGTLKAGAVYVPLDPTYPEQRLRFMLQDSGAQLLLLDHRTKSLLPGYCDQINVEAELQSEGPWAHPRPEISLDNTAYVIYTSGSTGQPKGVVVTHRGLANYLINWVQNAYPVSSGRGALVASSIAFDLTVTGIFAPLLAGREVWLVPEDAETDGLVSILRDAGSFSFVKLTPAHLELLGQQLAEESMAGSTQAFVVGGEALQSQTILPWLKSAPHTAIFNEYGPTEATVGCCVYRVPPTREAAGPVPIGRPIANTNLYILDRWLRPVPVEVAGELYIGGASLARGYLGRPEVTAEKFIPSPFCNSAGARLYKTGDLARYTPDGNIEFLGRADDQVKIRGYRIELGEIETTLRDFPGVNETVALIAQDANGQKRIVAYVACDFGSEREGDVHAHVKARLPGYMLPSAIVCLKQLPLTANGKVDRKSLALGEHARLDLAKKYVAPRSTAETKLASIWKEVLGVSQVGIHDSFFELGGHSLMIGQIVARVRKAFHVELQARTFFESPTVAQQVVTIAMKQAELTGIDETVRLISELRRNSASSAD